LLAIRPVSVNARTTCLPACLSCAVQGLAAAAGLTRLMSSLLFGVAALDPVEALRAE
jgi:hypothetical protein